MLERDAVLFANTAFYAAFASRDVAAMDRVWAKDRTVTCAHPGRPAIQGRKAVMESWRAILSNPHQPQAECCAEQAAIYGDTAVVTCIERLDDQYLAATNVFVKTGPVWSMVHHQAGPANVDPKALEKEEAEKEKLRPN